MFGPSWLKNEHQAMAAYFKASKLMLMVGGAWGDSLQSGNIRGHQQLFSLAALAWGTAVTSGMRSTRPDP